jgi:hypothetical protein
MQATVLLNFFHKIDIAYPIFRHVSLTNVDYIILLLSLLRLAELEVQSLNYV